MSNRILQLSAAAAMIVATPALATAQSVAYSTSPVAVTSCSVNASLVMGLSPDEAVQFMASDIALKFVNKSNVPATTVTFLVNEGKYTQSIVDKGTFSPGVQIKHNFAVGSDISAFSDATCIVTEVDFGDGIAWHFAPGGVAKR
jgi:hypothetical protein